MEAEYHHPVGREIRNLCQQDSHPRTSGCVCWSVCVVGLLQGKRSHAKYHPAPPPPVTPRPPCSPLLSDFILRELLTAWRHKPILSLLQYVAVQQQTGKLR